MQREEDIEYLLSRILITPYDMKFPEYFRKVLLRLPEDAFDFFDDENKLQVMQPIANSYYYYEPRAICKFLKDQSRDSFVCPADKELKVIFLMFTSTLCDLPEDDIIYTIAHELAHVYLNHPLMIEGRDKEIEADKQVIEWGFEKELRGSSHSYILGKHNNTKSKA